MFQINIVFPLKPCAIQLLRHTKLLTILTLTDTIINRESRDYPRPPPPPKQYFSNDLELSYVIWHS